MQQSVQWQALAAAVPDDSKARVQATVTNLSSLAGTQT